MATYSKGILGGFSGTVGTVVGGSWKGIEYMRSKAQKRSFVPTEAQLVHRAKFSLVGKFIQSMAALLNFTLKDYANRMTGANYAFSYIMDSAVTGIYPAFKVNYPLAVLAKGSLPNAPDASSAAGDNGDISFGWANNSGNGSAAVTDKSILIAYCEDVNQCIYTLDGPVRSTAEAILQCPQFQGKKVQTWISFLSASGKEIATSIFTGEVTLA
jgi:hypothetical protein